MFKIGYFGFNNTELNDCSMVARIGTISRAISKATGCDETNLIISVQASYNGKRHVEITPMNEPKGAAGRAACAVHDAGYNVIVFHNVQSVYWKEGLEK